MNSDCVRGRKWRRVMVVLADSTAFALSEIGGRYEPEYIEDQPVKIQFLQGGCAVCRADARVEPPCSGC